MAIRIAERGELVEDPLRLQEVGHHLGLGDFEREDVGRQLVVLQVADNPVEEASVDQLTPRDVDGHADVQSGPTPIRQVRAGLRRGRSR